MVLAVIPARYASTRLSAKPLALIGAKPMLQHVWERATSARLVDQVAIATDDQRIVEAARSWGAQVFLTDPNHPSGTDRVAEVARHFNDTKIIVNVQGDEPLLRPEAVDQVVEMLQSGPASGLGAHFDISTLACALTDAARLQDPNVVKVARAHTGAALYFSRHPIPYLRDTPTDQWIEHHLHFQHIGMYAFRTPILLEVAQLAPSPLERAESLEQLRWLEQGYRIGVGITQYASIGVDTPEDLERVRLMM
jgi:3-deoxy-manno-octulosonate cytidylyltransferase (CMP-KDO synthetase)